MIQKQILRKILHNQNQQFNKENYIERRAEIPDDSNGKVIILTGLRGSGKTTFIRQKFKNDNKALYVNFEDPRMINFGWTDFGRLEELALEEEKNIILLDEVQRVDKWEVFARKMVRQNIKIIVASSDALVFKDEVTKELAGRYVHVELFPLNYSESLQVSGAEKGSESFVDYFRKGGLPAVYDGFNENYMHKLFQDVVLKEIAVQKGIRNEKDLMRLAVHLMGNVGEEFSFNNTAKQLEIKSVRSVIDYCSFYNEYFLMEYVPLFTKSANQQLINPKKIYCTDPALAWMNNLLFEEGDNQKLENFVYMSLRRNYSEIFYYRDSEAECDFIVRDKRKNIMAVQCSYEINPDNVDKELVGLKNAMKAARIKEGVIITYNQKEKIDEINLLPALEWII